MKRMPLRQRVALTYGLIGLLLSVCFAVATFFVAEDYEAILIDALFAGEVEAMQRSLEKAPDRPLPVSARFAAWREVDAPVQFRGMRPGIHEVEMDNGVEMHAGVYGDGPQRIVFAIDVGRVETLETYLARMMLAIIVGGTLLSAWLGWLLSRQAIRPVARLSESVNALPVRPVQTTLAAGHAHDEIGRLATAIDQYQQRLVDVDRTEKQFFGNASHELRTPIAVIQGAVEVLNDDPALDNAQRGRLARIDRAVLELGSLLEALLLAARGLPAENEAVDVAALLQDTVARIASAEPDTRRRLQVRTDHGLTVQAPRRWVAAILTVLLQRVLTKSPGTNWLCVVGADGLSLQQPDADGHAADRVQRSDLGLGLMFVERLCRDLDWQLLQSLDHDGRLSIRVDVAPRKD